MYLTHIKETESGRLQFRSYLMNRTPLITFISLLALDDDNKWTHLCPLLKKIHEDEDKFF